MAEAEKEGVKIVSLFMAVSARTAPKTGGKDWIAIKVATDEDKDFIVAKMRELADRKRSRQKDPQRGEAMKEDWLSDASAVDQADSMLLLGVEGRKTAGLNCGGCGFKSCAELTKGNPLPADQVDFPGPFCMFRIMDLGIAAASAAKTAADHNVDNRMMQKAGLAVLKLGILDPCDLALGIPLSATGKNLFFDRAAKIIAWKTLGKPSDTE